MRGEAFRVTVGAQAILPARQSTLGGGLRLAANKRASRALQFFTPVDDKNLSVHGNV